MKFAICALLLALAVAEITAETPSHNIQWGTVGANDRLLYREIIVKKYAWLQVVTQDVEYKGSARITAVKCTDQYTNGNGGYATLYNGGPGYVDVTIHLKSQRGHGFNFIVEIYGNNN